MACGLGMHGAMMLTSGMLTIKGRGESTFKNALFEDRWSIKCVKYCVVNNTLE